ncbi:MAG: HAMP domain-containing protein, partial [Planctomycetota bacterium]
MASRPQPPGKRRNMTPPPPTRGGPPQPPAGGNTPAPKGGGGAVGAGKGQPAPPPVRKLKTQGAPIKRKFVLAMSGISLGVSLLIFIVVMIISQSSLEDTIVQSGKGNLQQAEALYRPYEAGLNDKALIGYFGQSKNASKFSKWWSGAQSWYHPNIKGYRGFSSFEEMYEDRLWVLVAGQLLVPDDDGKSKLGKNLSPDERIRLFGPAYYDLQRKFFEAGSNDMSLKGGKIGKGVVLDEPDFGRRLDHTFMASKVHMFSSFLIAKAGLPLGREHSFDQIKTAIRKKTKEKLVDGPGGLRMQIITHFKGDFVADLDKLTTSETSQVRFIHVKFNNSPAPMVSPEVVNLLSPNPTTDTIPVTSEGKTFNEEGITIDSSASVDNKKAYKFEREIRGEGTVIAVYLDREEINGRKNTLVLSILGVSVLAIVLALGLAFFIGNSVTKPLEVLMRDIQIISGGNFDHRPQARSRDEIGIVAKLLGDMALGLKSAQDVWLENQGRKHDMDVAKEIQENLLPKHVPRIAGYDVSAYYSPCKEVGGDYYDFFLVDKTHLGMICADVSGKGIPGSMVMMMAKALVSYEAQDNFSPRDIFCKV